MKKILFTLLAIILVAPLVACSQTSSSDIVESDEHRITEPETSVNDENLLVEGNRTFAFDLYQTLKDTDGNLFYSPYSISAALAMTYAGARSQTEQEMADTLHFMLPQDKLHPAFNELDLELDKRGEGAEGKDDEGFRLNVVNAIWGQKDFEFLPEFLDVLAQNYGAGLRILDFIENTEEARVTINDWISEQTENRIEDMIPQGVLDAATRLVLTNAIYFNAAWMYQFEPSMTEEKPFTILDGGTVNVPMMRQTESFGYTEGDGYQAAEMLYDGGELSMVILLPENGKFEEFEASLDAEFVDAIINTISRQQVSVTMPKFEFDSKFDLSDALAAMGMPDAFTMNADFSGMTGAKNLFISKVLHNAFVTVDESGTEAAAATVVDIKLTAALDEPVTFTVDHPFIFLIRDIETGAVLFVGRVLNPVN